MSINAKYRRITPQELAEFQRDPSLIAAFFGIDKLDEIPEDVDDDFDEEAYFAYTSPVDDPDRLFDLSKFWQAIHCLLTGEITYPLQSNIPPPLVYVVMGGTTISDVDVGYGPPRYLTPGQVAEAAGALQELSPERLRGSIDLSTFNAARIYPADAAGGWQTEDVELLIEEYDELRQFFQKAAHSGDALLLWAD